MSVVRPSLVVRWLLCGTAAGSQRWSNGVDGCHSCSHTEQKKTFWNHPKITKSGSCNRRSFVLRWRHSLHSRCGIHCEYTPNVFPNVIFHSGVCVCMYVCGTFCVWFTVGSQRGGWHQTNTIWSVPEPLLKRNYNLKSRGQGKNFNGGRSCCFFMTAEGFSKGDT